MSANGDGDDEIPGRELAYRLFAAEYDDASFSYAESDEERAPNYVITPTGARLNRVFAVGTLTEVTSVNDEMVRARVVDPTGAFVVYAGQYQPDELAFLEQAEPPAFVAVTGKARTFQPDDSDQVYTSIRPETIATVDADTRDRWVVSAAEQTLDRIGTYAGAAEFKGSAEPRSADSEELTDALLEAGVESGLAAGIPLAREHYGTTPSYLAALRACALEAVEVVAGERDQVSGLALAPDATSPEYDATFASLADLDGVDTDALEARFESEPETAEPVAATTDGSGTAAADPEDTHSGSAAGTATSEGHESTDIDADLETADAAVEPDADVDDTDESDGSDELSDADEPAVESDDTDESDVEVDTGETAADTLEAEDDGDETARSDEAMSEVDDETTVVAASEPDDNDDQADDELGDFDAGDVDDGMYEMDESEREELEEEFGTEFTAGSEVDEPGEAGIDVPEPEDAAADELEGESEPDDAESDDGDAITGGESDESDDDIGTPPESGLEDAESDEAAESEPAADVESEPDGTEPDDESVANDEPAEDVDLEAAVVETMNDLDDGDGADRTELIETVAADTGASADDVEDAIQDALMGGQCYEPDDETLKAI
ncbi:hypothetical protein CP556_12765 [Natrinema sp. CBA1119]|uniref:hypothetical protein n=1 Tax=Natrinema sp. CBA1119 TaxID=1608465 RepID=UPI000BF2EF69|nr:hypothetical protein [Natrinema sp. CBA1119]PGF16906.1 hypothetical protein CP556_12765 [Natrinema sp. CBA1119]